MNPIRLMALTAVLSAYPILGASQAQEPASPEGLIPARSMISVSFSTDVEMSPDGAFATFVQLIDNRRKLLVAPLTEHDPGLTSPFDVVRERRDVIDYIWSNDSRFIAVAVNNERLSTTQLYIYDTRKKQGRFLDSLSIASWAAVAQHELAVEGAPRSGDDTASSIDLVNLSTGHIRRLPSNGDASPIFNSRFDKILETKLTTKEGIVDNLVVRQCQNSHCKPAFVLKDDDYARAWSRGYSDQDNAFYFLDPAGGDFVALKKYSLTDGQIHQVYRSNSAEVRRIIVDGHGSVVGVATDSDGVDATIFFSQPYRELHQKLVFSLRQRLDSSRPDYGYSVLGVADARWLVRLQRTTEPDRYLVFNTETHQLRPLPLLDAPSYSYYGKQLAKLHTVQIPMKDGRLARLFYTVPTHSNPIGIVVLVHGGPWFHDRSEFRPDHQFFASRGYAVVSINYRGSDGAGLSWLNAGRRQQGLAANDDVIQSALWARAKFPAKDDIPVAIMGASFGGYHALMAMARRPDLFSCGVSISAPTDLVADVDYSGNRLNRSFFGDPANINDRHDLELQSPLSVASAIAAPVFLIHGGRDTTVLPDHSRNIMSRLQQYGKSAALWLLPAQGHTMSYEADIRVFSAIERFFGRCLGGSTLPMLDGDAHVVSRFTSSFDENLFEDGPMKSTPR